MKEPECGIKPEAVRIPVPDLWPFQKNMVLMVESDTNDQSNLNEQYCHLPNKKGQNNDGEIIVEANMTCGYKYVNVMSLKYKQTLFSCTETYNKADADYFNVRNTAFPRSNVKFHEELIRVHNGKMKSRNHWYQPDFLQEGHSVARDIGGLDVQWNIQTQSGRSNQGIKKFVDLWQRKLYDVGYEKISFLDGILFKDQIRDEFLANSGSEYKVDVNGENFDVPYAGYHVYSAWKGDKNHLFCFFWPQYGLSEELNLRSDWSAKKWWNTIKKYAIDPDLLAELIGFRFITETLKSKTEFVNEFDGNRATFGIMIPDPDPNHVE
jgi:hypothetical protein